MATRIATPTAVPSCNAARVDAFAIEKRAAPTSRTPADCSMGNVMLMPSPDMTAAGNQSAQ